MTCCALQICNRCLEQHIASSDEISEVLCDSAVLFTFLLALVPAPTILWGPYFVDTVATGASVIGLNLSYVLPIIVRITYPQPALDTSRFQLGR